MPDIDLESLKKEIGADKLDALPRDVSPRHYFRAYKNGKPSIVMVYPDASDADRAELSTFLEIGSRLASYGIKVPAELQSNADKAYAVLEDLGTISFGDCFRGDIIDKAHLYTLATDVLIRLRDIKEVDHLPKYAQSRIYKNRRQLIDYYMAFTKGAHPGEEVVQEFLSIWDGIENSLPPCPHGFVHGDYHLENLMYVEQESGTKQCALIDYQDALNGPLPYDLVNLIEDARIDIPPETHQAMIARYCDGMSADEKDVFLKWFRVLAAQFHGRVIGLFIMLAAEQGRDKYLIHIPRLQNYLKKSLQDPVLAPLKGWFDKVGLDLEAIKDLDGNHIRKAFETIRIDR